MNLTRHNPPHIRSKDSVFTMMCDMVIALLFLNIMGWFFYGLRAPLLTLISVAVCVLADAAAVKMSGRKVSPADLSPVITGMLIPLMLPASIDFKIVVAAGLFAILVAKQPFGGLGQNIFNPAVAGLAFAAVTWPGKVFSYPIPMGRLPVLLSEGAVKLVNSPAYKLKMGGTPSYDFLDMLLGNFPGPMGATSIIVLLACLAYLVLRRCVDGKMALSFLGASAVFAFLFPRISAGRFQSVAYELMSGVLLFAAVFLISDPTTSPKRESSKMVYAAVAGIVTMLFRYFGGFEESIFFAILLMNAMVWPLDLKLEEYHSAARSKRNEEKSQKIS